MDENKLAILVLGKPNSGKSNTWYAIFNRTIRTGWKKLVLSNSELDVFVKNSSFEETGKEISIDIFIRNASFEEYGDEAIDFFDLENLPKIVFCSVQYIEKGIRTINWFKDNGYYLYIQWLNPGYKYDIEYSDYLDFEKTFKDFGEFQKVTGKEKVNRTLEIRRFLLNWILKNGK
ncbi:MAG: hypothetical protein NTY07_05785 [Bacteroidia bacterium]|nr:hypothetical protein [Bacteroidia bacterium]